MIRTRFAAALTAALLFPIALGGCAALTVDVDVYKGPLANHKNVQTEQLATLAVGAQPLLERVQRIIAGSNRELEQIVSDLLALYKDESNADPQALLEGFVSHGRQLLIQYEASVRVMELGNSTDETCADALDKATGNAPASFNDAGKEALEKLREAYRNFLQPFNDDDDHALRKWEPVLDAHNELHRALFTQDPGFAANSLPNAPPLDRFPPTSAQDPRRNSNAGFRFLADNGAMVADHMRLLTGDPAIQRDAAGRVAAISNAFMEARAQLRSLLELALEALQSGPIIEFRNPEDERAMRDAAADFLVKLVACDHFFAAMKLNDCDLDARNFIQAFQARLTESNVVSSDWSKSCSQVRHALAAMLSEEGDASAGLLKLHKAFMQAPDYTPTGGIDSKFGVKERREFGLALAALSGDSSEHNSLDSDSLESAYARIESAAQAGALASRGRTREGIFTRIENYLAASTAMDPDPVRLDRMRQILSDELVRFAEKLLVIANHESLFRRGASGGTRVDSRGATSETSLHAATGGKRALFTYVQVLQAVGNQIIVQANELTVRADYEQRQDAATPREQRGVRIVYGGNPEQMYDAMASAIAKRTRFAVDDEAGADAAVNTARADFAVAKSNLTKAQSDYETALGSAKPTGTKEPDDPDDYVRMLEMIAPDPNADPSDLPYRLFQFLNLPEKLRDSANAGLQALPAAPLRLAAGAVDPGDFAERIAYEGAADQGGSALPESGSADVTPQTAEAKEEVPTAGELRTWLLEALTESLRLESELRKIVTATLAKESDSADAYLDDLKNEIAKRARTARDAEAQETEQAEAASARLAALRDAIDEARAEYDAKDAAKKEAEAERELLATVKQAVKLIDSHRTAVVRSVMLHSNTPSAEAIKAELLARIEADDPAAAPSRRAAIALIENYRPPLDMLEVSRSEGKSQKDILDDVIAALRQEHIAVVRESGKDSPQAQNVQAAIDVAYEQRSGMVYIRSANAYLRSSYVSTALQSSPGLAWDNMLAKHAMKMVPLLGKAINNPPGWKRKIQDEIDRQYWQSINRIRTAGGGKTLKVLVKDDIGNWYVKGFSADPEDVIKSATNLAMFNLGANMGANLVAEYQAAAAEANAAKSEEDLLKAETKMALARGPLHQVHAHYLKVYVEKSSADLAAVQAMLAKDGVAAKVSAAWDSTAYLPGMPEFKKQLMDALKQAGGKHLEPASKVVVSKSQERAKSTEDLFKKAAKTADAPNLIAIAELGATAASKAAEAHKDRKEAQKPGYVPDTGDRILTGLQAVRAFGVDLRRRVFAIAPVETAQAAKAMADAARALEEAAEDLAGKQTEIAGLQEQLDGTDGDEAAEALRKKIETAKDELDRIEEIEDEKKAALDEAKAKVARFNAAEQSAKAEVLGVFRDLEAFVGARVETVRDYEEGIVSLGGAAAG